MRKAFQFTGLVTAWMIGGLALAQAPATAPAGSTGMCKDGTYSQAAKKQGACRGHKGVETWYAAAGGAAAAAPTAAASTAAPPASKAAAAAPAAPAAPTAPAASRTPAATSASRAAAPGGGPGQVWVNTGSKVYHCPGDRYYGKTKSGAYMSEAEAKAGGNRPDHNKPCQ